MKNKSITRTDQEPPQFLKHRESMGPFKIQSRIVGVDIPGFGKRYSCLALKGPMARKSGPLADQHDPCFWNRGGGRWFHTKRRGGQVGRQRGRGLPRAPFAD